MEEMGPNDVRCIVWASSKFFFFFLLCLINSNNYMIQIQFMFLMAQEKAGDENMPNASFGPVFITHIL